MSREDMSEINERDVIISHFPREKLVSEIESFFDVSIEKSNAILNDYVKREVENGVKMEDAIDYFHVIISAETNKRARFLILNLDRELSQNVPFEKFKKQIMKLARESIVVTVLTIIPSEMKDIVKEMVADALEVSMSKINVISYKYGCHYTEKVNLVETFMKSAKEHPYIKKSIRLTKRIDVVMYCDTYGSSTFDPFLDKMLKMFPCDKIYGVYYGRKFLYKGNVIYGKPVDKSFPKSKADVLVNKTDKIDEKIESPKSSDVPRPEAKKIRRIEKLYACPICTTLISRNGECSFCGSGEKERDEVDAFDSDFDR